MGILYVLLFLYTFRTVEAQFTSQTYPDPRIDPFSCKIPTTGPICDPSELLTFAEKKALADRVNQLLSLASTVPNTSPACQPFPGKSLEIIIGVIDKIGTVPLAQVDIEKFANNLKSRYQHFQDVSLCDAMVLIVNSKSDRQVFTVAGKDTKLTKDMLKAAFEQNVNHFKANRFADGLRGMAEYIVEAYRSSQGVPTFRPQLPSENIIGGAPVLNGVRQTNEKTGHPEPATTDTAGENEIASNAVIVPVENESDQLWIDILTQAVSRCGNNQEKLSRYAQGVVEEAMSMSLRLIADPRYTTIEEDTQSASNNLESRNQAWEKARVEFIDSIYQKYATNIRSRANLRCPARLDTAKTFSRLKHLIKR